MTDSAEVYERICGHTLTTSGPPVKMGYYMAYLKDIREQAGKNQKQVARDLNTSVSTINRHEHGKTPLSDFHRTTYGVYYGVKPESIEQPLKDEGRRAA